MDASTTPTLLPIHIQNFNLIMPEPRSFPRFIPRLLSPRIRSMFHSHSKSTTSTSPVPNYTPTIAFGTPIMLPDDLIQRIDDYRARRPTRSTKEPANSLGGMLKVQDEIPGGMVMMTREGSGDGQSVLKLRRDITSFLQSEMEALGRRCDAAAGGEREAAKV